jgi:hypothetical protein
MLLALMKIRAYGSKASQFIAMQKTYKELIRDELATQNELAYRGTRIISIFAQVNITNPTR